jgi:hypothetical protein
MTEHAGPHLHQIVRHTFTQSGRRYALVYAYCRNPEAEAQVAMWHMREDSPIPAVKPIKHSDTYTLYKEV